MVRASGGPFRLPPRVILNYNGGLTPSHDWPYQVSLAAVTTRPAAQRENIGSHSVPWHLQDRHRGFGDELRAEALNAGVGDGARLR